MVAGVRWSPPRPAGPYCMVAPTMQLLQPERGIHGVSPPGRNSEAARPHRAAPLGIGKRGGGDGNRTRVQGFAGPCLSHSATPPQGACRKGIQTFPSGRRDSNPRPSPWQGDALPTEPRPHRPSGAAIRTVADPAARANSDGLPMSPQVSGIFRAGAHSGHVLRDLAQRPGRVAEPVPCGRTSHFVGQSPFDGGRKIRELASRHDGTGRKP